MRVEIMDVFGDQRAAFVSGHAGKNEATCRLRRREPLVVHGSLRFGVTTPKKPASSAFVQFATPFVSSHAQ
jgi:hypothetical protein